MKNKDQILLESLYEKILLEGKKETIDYLQKNGADKDAIILFSKQDATGKPLFPTDQAIIMFNWIKDNQVNYEDIEKDYNNFKKYFPNKNLKDFKDYLNFSETVHAKVGEKEFENRNKDVGVIDVHGDDKENVIADDQDVLILKGDNEHKCVRYGKGYSFCISRPGGGNMYGNYRLSKASTFYFIYFKKIPKENPKHIMVLDRTQNGWEWTFGENQTEVIEGGWDEVIKEYPILAKYADKFENKELTDEEKNYQQKLGDFVKQPEKKKFEKFSYKEKADVLKFGMDIPEDVFDSLDKFLKNEYISVGPAIKQNIFDKLNDNEKERYLKVRKTIINQHGINTLLDREIILKDPELFEKIAKDDIDHGKKSLKNINKIIEFSNNISYDRISYFSIFVPFILENLKIAHDTISCNKTLEVILPKLEKASDLNLFDAIKINLDSLVSCGSLYIPKVEEIFIPNLEMFNDCSFSSAKILDLPNLISCDELLLFNDEKINLPKLKYCHKISFNSKIVNLPNLISCDNIDTYGVEELYLPKLNDLNKIYISSSVRKVVIPKKFKSLIPRTRYDYISTNSLGFVPMEIIHPEEQEVKVESFKQYFNKI
jgi:hypothetical protein